MLKAVTRQASLVDAKLLQINQQRSQEGQPKVSTAYFFDHYATKEDVAVMVTEEDFLNAERELIPSVSAKELEHYSRVRGMFEKVADKPEAATGHEDTPAAARQSGIPDRTAAAGVVRSNGDRKGKGKAIATSTSSGKGKGKGKAVASGWNDDDDVDADEEEVETNGYRDKGKGKAVFDHGSVDDDEGLY